MKSYVNQLPPKDKTFIKLIELLSSPRNTQNKNDLVKEILSLGYTKEELEQEIKILNGFQKQENLIC